MLAVTSGGDNVNPDFSSLLGNPNLWGRFDELQRLLRHKTFTVASDTGMLKITFNYQQEVIDIFIDNRLLDPAKAGALKSTLVETVNQGMKEARNRMVSEAQRMFTNP
jgi:DNA-binding protein YbaB